MLYECTACDSFTTTVDVMLVAHQSICPGLEPEKREFRRDILVLHVGEENVRQAQELAESQAAHQS